MTEIEKKLDLILSLIGDKYEQKDDLFKVLSDVKESQAQIIRRLNEVEKSLEELKKDNGWG